MKLEFLQLSFIAYCIGYYALHSLMASNWLKAIIKLSPQAYRLLFNFVAVVTLIPGFVLFRKFGGMVDVNSIWLFYLGIGLAGIGSIILLVAFKNYDLREFSGLGKRVPNEELQINGMNRYVRHPLYSGAFLIVWGMYISSLQEHYLIVAIITSIYIFIGTKLEERKLIVDFGEDYLRYKEEVGMFFPGTHLWR